MAIATTLLATTMSVPASDAGPAGVDLPYSSANVELVGHVAQPGIVGGRFRDGLFYATSTDGLHIYDVANPALPTPVGFLPLPNMMNEDVSIGGNTLLIATDYGINQVTVVDISNPRLPTVVRRLAPRASAHTVSCVADCTWAFLAGDGITALNTVTGQEVGGVAPHVGWSHDVQFDSDGIAWMVGDRGTAGYDVSNPTAPRLLAKTDHTGSVGPLNDFIHHNSARPDGPDGEPGDIVLITEEDWLRPRCNRAGLFETWRIEGALDPAKPAVLRNLDSWDTDQGLLPTGEEKELTALCSAHYFDERDGFVAIGWYEQGVRILDVRDPSNIRQVGYWVLPATDTFASLSAYWVPTDPTGSIVYAFDHTRGIDIIRVDKSAPAEAPFELPGVEERAATQRATTQPHPTFGWACRIPVSAS